MLLRADAGLAGKIQGSEPASRAGWPSDHRKSVFSRLVEAWRAITMPESSPAMLPPNGAAAKPITHPKGSRARKVAALARMAANTMTNTSTPGSTSTRLQCAPSALGQQYRKSTILGRTLDARRTYPASRGMALMFQVTDQGGQDRSRGFCLLGVGIGHLTHGSSESRAGRRR
jgi:hypothetical protein